MSFFVVHHRPVLIVYCLPYDFINFDSTLKPTGFVISTARCVCKCVHGICGYLC